MNQRTNKNRRNSILLLKCYHSIFKKSYFTGNNPLLCTGSTVESVSKRVSPELPLSVSAAATAACVGVGGPKAYNLPDSNLISLRSQ